MIRSIFAALTLVALSAPAMAHDITFGALELNAPFARATLPNAPVAGGFLTIVNTGDADDRLLRAEVTFASDAQIHEMAMDCLLYTSPSPRD